MVLCNYLILKFLHNNRFYKTMLILYISVFQ